MSFRILGPSVLILLQAFLDSAPRKDGKLTRAAEAGARKV
jgi:hypothetical protein